MTRDDALLDNVAELVLQADDPRRLAERTLDVVCSLCNGRSGAVFVIEEGNLTLFASKAVEQSGLDVSRAVWEGRRASLSRGEVFYVPDRSLEPQLPAEGRSAPNAFALAPVRHGQELVGLLYVDSDDPHFLEPHDRARLARLASVLVKAMRGSGPGAESADAGWARYLERTPVEDMEREKLLLLLNRNEWNIARVARLMGVTRRTIYLRLARFNIPREKVSKTRRGSRARAAKS